MSDLPARRIDRAALERIIQRAAELQTGERELGDELSEAEVLALGKEVGIPGRYLQQALLEERTRAAPTSSGGLAERLVGPSAAAASRVIQGEAGVVERLLLRWMEDRELLALQRQQPGRLTWEPLGGIPAAIRRSTAALGGSRHPYMLSKAETVGATIAQLEPGYVQVTLTADLKPVRNEYLGWAVGMAGAGATGTAVLLVMGAFLPVAVAPAAGGLLISALVARQHRPIAERTRLGLERVLDQLERGAVKPSHALPDRRGGVIGLIADEVRKALRP